MRIDWTRVLRTTLQAFIGSAATAIGLLTATDLSDWRAIVWSLVAVPVATAIAAGMNRISEDLDG